MLDCYHRRMSAQASPARLCHAHRLKCSGTEATLLACSYEAFNDTACDDDDAAAVLCGGKRAWAFGDAAAPSLHSALPSVARVEAGTEVRTPDVVPI